MGVRWRKQHSCGNGLNEHRKDVGCNLQAASLPCPAGELSAGCAPQAGDGACKQRELVPLCQKKSHGDATRGGCSRLPMKGAVTSHKQGGEGGEKQAR